MTTLYLITIAALLPCLMCQEVFVDPLCKDMVCPANQTCRHYKPCDQSETCDVTTICAPIQELNGFKCKFGDPVIFNPMGTSLNYVWCHQLVPCPTNYHCTTQMPWPTFTVCCLSDPAETVRQNMMCPVHEPGPNDNDNCIDECKFDGDCGSSFKCCYTDCSKRCVLGAPLPNGPPLSTLAPPIDPCVGKVCPAGEECRYFKACERQENCNATAICSAISDPGSRDCRYGKPVLHTDYYGRKDVLDCDYVFGRLCPSNAYCKYSFNDSRCCLIDEDAHRVKSGSCPSPKQSRMIKNDDCYGKCSNDGDCDWEFKCCNTGCELECIKPL